jgi:hypothetical protein
MRTILRAAVGWGLLLWLAVFALAGQSPGAEATDADEMLQQAVAAARMGNVRAAEELLTRGARAFPGDSRFPTELAGIAFLAQRHAEARRHLHRARRLGSNDPYVAEFLGTLYLLEGNVEAALLLWGPVGRPVLVEDQISTGLEGILKPELANGAAAFRANTALTQGEFLLTERVVSLLGVCGTESLALEAEGEERYRAHVRCVERPAFGENRMATLLMLGRGLAYQSVHLRFPNLRQSAWNWNSLFRWDARKRRVWTETSMPLAGSARWRLYLDADARDEQWQMLAPDSRVVQQAFEHRRMEAGIAVSAVLGPRATWKNGIWVANRSFRHARAMEPDTVAGSRLLAGSSVRYGHRLDADLYRNPLRRVFVRTTAEASLERYFAAEENVARAMGSATVEWFPKASGSDYRTELRLTGGAMRGSPAVTEYFTAGLERDTLHTPGSALLRGHPGTSDGRKGSMLFGDRLVAANLETRKEVLRLGVLTVAAAPFLDVAWVRDSTGMYGGRQVRFDAGLQGIAMLPGGTELRMSYGWDLRNGRRAFYVWSQPFP